MHFVIRKFKRAKVIVLRIKSTKFAIMDNEMVNLLFFSTLVGS